MKNINTKLLGFWTFSIVWYSREHDVSENRRWKKSKNPVILCVIRHRQNRLEKHICLKDNNTGKFEAQIRNKL
jgi:hypothetical protein